MEAKKKKVRVSVIPANSEARNILIAFTCLEWQAEYHQPAKFESIGEPNSLTRAILSQYREFGKSTTKPYQMQNMYEG